MTDKTITKIDSAFSPRGEAGQKYLASGKAMSMRLWECEPESSDKAESQRDYETVGFVLKGKAELHIEGQMVLLNAGDSWSVPKGSSHRYKILETFSAVESTSPPAEVHGRDANMDKGEDKDNKNGEKAKSSANNSVAEFAKATSVQESAPKAAVEPAAQGAVDKTTEVSPMDKGAEDELDGTAPPKEGETAESKRAKAPAEADGDEEEAKDVQEIGAQIGRPDSKVTSNSPEKEAEPAEHVDLEKTT
jgi:quercetin dioxygenase-like cupin family protein